MAKRILIADDEQPIAEMLTEALHQEGYDTAKATESLRFFDAVREHQPDLILLDLMMPYLSGQDELRLLNMNEDTKHIPVIVVTAHPEAMREEDDLRQWGVVSIIIKPFDLEVLLKLIKDTIGEPQGVAR